MSLRRELLRHWAFLALASVCIAAAPSLAQGPAANGAKTPAPVPSVPRRTAVVLYSLPQDVPGLRELAAAISDGLQKGSPGGIDIYSEYTGLDRFSGPTYETSLLT